MKLYANLHSHSTHSDGVYTPSELVDVAKAEGYRAIALTDHDTATGFYEIKQKCEAEGLETVFGTEFSVPEFHIVGMNFDPNFPKMKEYLAGMSYRETDQTKILLDRGIQNGFLHDISWNEVLDYNKGITWLCNEHVFRAMKAKGIFTDRDYPFFFYNVYGVHRGEVPPAYDFLSAENMIKLIRDAGGIAILAHPHNQLKSVQRLVGYGLSGIEVWHNDLLLSERPDALRLAEKYHLFISGGSDHSGLCGGQYSRHPEPEKTEWYALPCSLGTTGFFFDEIKNTSLDPYRDIAIHTALEMCE